MCLSGQGDLMLYFFLASVYLDYIYPTSASPSPTNKGGMQDGRSVGSYTRTLHAPLDVLDVWQTRPGLDFAPKYIARGRLLRERSWNLVLLAGRLLVGSL